MRYSIDNTRTTVTAIATSNIHDTTCKLSQLTGWIETDLERATGTIEVDMRAIDAGDFLKTAKLKSDLELDRHPSAQFEITGLERVTRDGERVRATVTGTLRWRNREKPLQAQAEGTLSATSLDATATFSLDMRDFNLKPPRVLMFKVEPVVAVKVHLHAAAG